MKLSDFILLEAEEKKRAVLHSGVLVGKRTQGSSMVFLFQLPNYYIETYWDVESRAIEEFRAFESVAALSPYLESISLRGLIGE